MAIGSCRKMCGESWGLDPKMIVLLYTRLIRSINNLSRNSVVAKHPTGWNIKAPKSCAKVTIPVRHTSNENYSNIGRGSWSYTELNTNTFAHTKRSTYRHYGAKIQHKKYKTVLPGREQCPGEDGTEHRSRNFRDLCKSWNQSKPVDENSSLSSGKTIITHHFFREILSLEAEHNPWAILTENQAVIKRLTLSGSDHG